MNTDERALLRTICAEPDDDAPRLVYADWLDEHDAAPQAEFIRLQVDLASNLADSPARRRKAFRMRELRDEFEGFGNADLWRCWQTRRGLVEDAEVSGLTAPIDLNEAFAVTPLRRLRIIQSDNDLSIVREIPIDNQLVTLDLTSNYVDEEELVTLAGLPGLAGIRELGLMFTDISSEIVPVVCDLPFFQHLNRLHLGGNPLRDADRQRLRDHFGDRVTFTVERHADSLYTFAEDDDFTVGFGRGDTQVLLSVFPEMDAVAVFDHEGNVLQLREMPADEPRSDDGRGDAFEELQAEWELEPASIRIKRFRFPSGVGITDFPNGWVTMLESEGDHDRETAHDSITDWLADGQFCWNWRVGDWWLDRSGRVTST